jgi:hypothetical protein
MIETVKVRLTSDTCANGGVITSEFRLLTQRSR